MTEPTNNLGKDLNTTFLPQALLRKTDNKSNTTLNNKCTIPYIQTHFKKHPATPSSPSTHQKSNTQAINSKNPTLPQSELSTEHPSHKESQSFHPKVQPSQ